MKRIIFAIAPIIWCCALFSACSKYQYVSVQSDLTKSMGNSVIENDTVRITYTFKGQNCPVQIQVYNKTSKPIFVDWKKSALIINDNRLSYWEDKTVVNASTVGREVQWTNTVSSSSSTTTGVMSKSEQVSFIPPQSLVTASPLTVKNKFIDVPKETRDHRVEVTNSEPPSIGFQYSYSNENSPMKFRSYLTLSFDENFQSSFHFDNRFWVSEILQTGISADALKKPLSNDQFTIKKTTGFGKVMGGLLGIIILGGLIALKR